MGAAGIWTGDERPSVGWASGPGRWVLLHMSLLLCYLRVFAGGTLQFVVVVFKFLRCGVGKKTIIITIIIIIIVTITIINSQQFVIQVRSCHAC
jgi:hypothetical protein